MSTLDNATIEGLLRLPESQRADLAARLIDSLDSACDADADTAWADEIRMRLADLDSSRVKPVAWSEARSRILADTDESETG